MNNLVTSVQGIFDACAKCGCVDIGWRPTLAGFNAQCVRCGTCGPDAGDKLRAALAWNEAQAQLSAGRREREVREAIGRLPEGNALRSYLEECLSVMDRDSDTAVKPPRGGVG